MTKKLDKTQRELLLELHQGIYGISDTEENGLLGDVKEMVTQVRIQNDRIRKNEHRVFKIWGILIAIGALSGAGIAIACKFLGTG